MQEGYQNPGVVELIWARRRLVAAIALPIAAVFTILSFILTPVYRSSTVLVSASSEKSALNGMIGSALGSMGDVASLVGLNLGSRETEIEEALAVLQSRQLTETFILENKLMPELFWRLWDKKSQKWKVGELKRPTLERAYRRFDDIREVKKDSKTGLITLQIDWRDRFLAASWANGLVQRLNAEMRGRAISNADASLQYLQKELAVTTDIGTREAVNRLIEAQIKKRMLATVTQEYVLRVVDRAMVEDADHPVSPKKMLLITAGLLFGLLVGAACALIATSRSAHPSARMEL